MARKASLGLAILMGLALGVSACGGAGPQNAATSAPAKSARGSTSEPADTIVIKDFAFNPVNLTVTAGSTITVKNEDDSTHTVTADAGGFNTGYITPGHTATFKAPGAAGHYSYHCAIHNFMHGSLTVIG